MIGLLFLFVIEKYSPLREMRVPERNCTWIGQKCLMMARDILKTAALKNNLGNISLQKILNVRGT